MFVNDVSRHLRELVRQHQVCWEVWPVYLINRLGKQVQIGFELELTGTQPEHAPDPDGVECVRVYEDLKQIADRIMPKEEDDTRLEVGSFDASIHYSAKRKFRGEILLPIYILHWEGLDRPAGAGEPRCLDEMEERLKDLGASKDVWEEGPC